MSYNAALRAINLGYKNVLWYRGGIEAWQRAGLPLTNTRQGGGPQGGPPPGYGQPPGGYGGYGPQGIYAPREGGPPPGQGNAPPPAR
jgi:hypothetical protein